jgi:VanZ family protein
MSSNERGPGFWIRTWWPVAFMISVIALESTPTLGSDRTTGPFRYVFQLLFGHVADDRWEIIHHLIRKAGHFVGYGLVGLSWLRAWRRTRPNWLFSVDAALALAATAIIASADEFHQSFLPNRTSSPWDVLLDCTGALAMLLPAYAVIRLRRPRHIAIAIPD